MRYFTKIEKEIINYICDADPISDASTIKKLFEIKCDCSMQWHNDDLTIYVKDPSSTNEIVTKLISIICLLDYLRSEGLISLFRNINISNRLINREHSHLPIEDVCDDVIIEDGDTIPMIESTVNGNSALIALNPIKLSADFSKKIFEFYGYKFVCSENLRHIKGQDYKDDATIHYEENRKQTNIAIIISLIVGIVSILIGVFVGLLTYFQSEKHHQESISQTQKSVIVHDTIIQVPKPLIQEVTAPKSTVLNNTLKASHANSK